MLIIINALLDSNNDRLTPIVALFIPHTQVNIIKPLIPTTEVIQRIIARAGDKRIALLLPEMPTYAYSIIERLDVLSKSRITVFRLASCQVTPHQ